jgi:hypothetical protein
MNELRNRPRESRGMEREGPCLPSSAVSARCPQKRQRVAPCGSVPATPNTVWDRKPEEVPRRRAGARRAVRRRERVAVHLHGPAALAVKRGDRLERRRVGDAPGLALEDHVHPRQAP